NPLLRASNPLVTDLEQEVLDEYSRLLGNVNKLSDKLSDLAGSPSSLTLDGLRLLERKTATVCTLLKASVYSIVLQQQIFNESEEQQQQQAQQEEQQQ
ncbi:DASH complex subunit DAD3 family protein, partial [Aspergillus glaucus CBS 516.65]